MKSPSLAAQTALGGVLDAAPAVTALVIAKSGVPEGPFPVITIGEDQEIPCGGEDRVNRHHFEIYSTLHVWADEPGMTIAKEQGGAIVGAIRDGLPETDGVAFRDVRLESARYMRSGDGKLSHGVITLRIIAEVLP